MIVTLSVHGDDLWYCETWSLVVKLLFLNKKIYTSFLKFCRWYVSWALLRPIDREDEMSVKICEKHKWNNDDYICMRHILNIVFVTQLNIYQNFGLVYSQ